MLEDDAGALVTFIDSVDMSLLISRGGCELLHNSTDERSMIRSISRFKKD